MVANFSRIGIHHVPFDLSEPEKYLYDQVTKYINKYLGKAKGRKQAAVALARTVLQRRLASSLNAIFSSQKSGSGGLLTCGGTGWFIHSRAARSLN